MIVSAIEHCRRCKDETLHRRDKQGNLICSRCQDSQESCGSDGSGYDTA